MGVPGRPQDELVQDLQALPTSVAEVRGRARLVCARCVRVRVCAGVCVRASMRARELEGAWWLHHALRLQPQPAAPSARTTTSATTHPPAAPTPPPPTPPAGHGRLPVAGAGGRGADRGPAGDGVH